MRYLLIALLFFGCAEQPSVELPVAGSGSVDVAVETEALNGACTGGLNKEKARLVCNSWNDLTTQLYGFNCPRSNPSRLGFVTVTVQAGAPAGKNWYHVTPDYGTPYYDQCSCNDSAPCTRISALVGPSEAEVYAAPDTLYCNINYYLKPAAKKWVTSQLGSDIICKGADTDNTWPCYSFHAPNQRWKVQLAGAVDDLLPGHPRTPSDPDPFVAYLVTPLSGQGPSRNMHCRYLSQSSCDPTSCYWDN